MKDTLSVGTIDEAETKLKQLGYTWKWSADGSLLATTPTLPAVIQRNDGSKVFFNQLIAAYMGWQGVRENPSRQLRLVDGTEISKEALERIVELSALLTFDIEWQDNDVAIVDNYRTMYSRRAIMNSKNAKYCGNGSRRLMLPQESVL